MLQHHAGWIVRHDLADYLRRHDYSERERIILEYPWNIRPNGRNRLLEVADDLVVCSERWMWRNHHARGSQFHYTSGQGTHRSKAGRGDADNHRHVCAADNLP